MYSAVNVWNSQNIPHILPSYVRYGASFVRYLKENGRHILAPTHSNLFKYPVLTSVDYLNKVYTTSIRSLKVFQR